MLRGLKLAMLRMSRAGGLFRLTRDSEWRRQQLLILCYHGISIDDEHEWAPGLYMSQDAFGERIAFLKRGRYVVLPLGEAIRRLYDGTLPRRSVAITFDDGNFDFYARAWPVLEAAAVPATVYLTTYYAERNLPIFPLATSYMMWKRQGRVASIPIGDGDRLAIDTRSPEARKQSQDRLILHSQDADLSALEKDRLAAALGDVLGFDYAEIVRRRMLRIMTTSEVGELASAGVDFQLHTHRHRSPLDRAAYVAEIDDNRERIVRYTGQAPEHFCYPSGVSMPQFGPWLDALGVKSATTCEPGIATRASNPFQLPRLLDHSELTDIEFESWLTGIGSLLPHRSIGFQPVDTDGRLIIPRPSPSAAAPELTTAGDSSSTINA